VVAASASGVDDEGSSCVSLHPLDMMCVFAPYARATPCSNAGGGGERVLWCAIAALARSHDARRLRVVVYCGDDPAAWDVDRALADAARRFGITIPRDLDFDLVYVRQRALLEPQRCVPRPARKGSNGDVARRRSDREHDAPAAAGANLSRAPPKSLHASAASLAKNRGAAGTRASL
jgi:hypothetical protein